jgi:hypothetical protein
MNRRKASPYDMRAGVSVMCLDLCQIYTYLQATVQLARSMPCEKERGKKPPFKTRIEGGIKTVFRCCYT